MSKHETAKISVRVYMTREERKLLKSEAVKQNKSLTRYIYDILKSTAADRSKGENL